MDNRRTCLLDCMLRNGGLTVHFPAPAVRVIEPVPGPPPPLIHVGQTRVVAPVPDRIGTTPSPTVYLSGDSGLKETLCIHCPSKKIRGYFYFFRQYLWLSVYMYYGQKTKTIFTMFVLLCFLTESEAVHCLLYNLDL